MSLSNRFSIVLLGILGLILVGFSTALFITSRIYLNRQIDDRLTAILNVLNTCVVPNDRRDREAHREPWPEGGPRRDFSRLGTALVCSNGTCSRD
jgi:hypothetical protein